MDKKIWKTLIESSSAYSICLTEASWDEDMSL